MRRYRFSEFGKLTRNQRHIHGLIGTGNGRQLLKSARDRTLIDSRFCCRPVRSRTRRGEPLVCVGLFALFMPGQQSHLLSEGQFRMPRPKPAQIGNAVRRFPEFNQLFPRTDVGHVSLLHGLPQDSPLRLLRIIFSTSECFQTLSPFDSGEPNPAGGTRRTSREWLWSRRWCQRCSRLRSVR